MVEMEWIILRVVWSSRDLSFIYISGRLLPVRITFHVHYAKFESDCRLCKLANHISADPTLHFNFRRRAIHFKAHRMGMPCIPKSQAALVTQLLYDTTLVASTCPEHCQKLASQQIRRLNMWVIVSYLCSTPGADRPGTPAEAPVSGRGAHLCCGKYYNIFNQHYKDKCYIVGPN